MSLVILGNLCYTPKFRVFFFSCNRLSGQDFIVLQRLMKEPIEDVQVNQFSFNPDVVLELSELQNPSSE